MVIIGFEEPKEKPAGAAWAKELIIGPGIEG
jgi:hypothetical protein